MFQNQLLKVYASAARGALCSLVSLALNSTTDKCNTHERDQQPIPARRGTSFTFMRLMVLPNMRTLNDSSNSHSGVPAPFVQFTLRNFFALSC